MGRKGAVVWAQDGLNLLCILPSSCYNTSNVYHHDSSLAFASPFLSQPTTLACPRGCTSPFQSIRQPEHTPAAVGIRGRTPSSPRLLHHLLLLQARHAHAQHLPRWPL